MKTIALLIWVWLPNGQHWTAPASYYDDEKACIQRVSEIMSKRYSIRIQAMCGHVIGEQDD